MIMRQWPWPGAKRGAERYWQKVQAVEHHLENLIDRNCRIWAWDRTLRFNDLFSSRMEFIVVKTNIKSGQIYTFTFAVHH